MRLRRLDLNLLIALDALLSLRSVTAAAHQLHVTQPSMSASLARLREHFDDRLLVQVGRRMELTSLGEELTASVRETLQKIDQTITLRSGFDPKVAKRSFSMCASDGTVLVLLSQVIARLEAAAPRVAFHLLPAEHGNAVAMLGRQELDFVFSGPTFVIADQPHTTVIQDHYVCLAWERNSRIGKRLSAEQYLELGHVVARFGFERRPGYEEHQLRQRGIKRRVEVSCSSVSLLGSLLVGSDRVATVPSRLGTLLARAWPLRVLPVPLELAEQEIDMYWHRGRDQDPASRWFRDAILATSREMGMLEAG
jgi:LysR family transcriptional regulator, nod-box dependent transcriptional activator